MAKMCADLARLFIEAREYCVKILAVITEIGDGALASWFAIVRDPLPEAFDARHLSRHPRRGFHRDIVLQRRWLRHHGDGDGTVRGARRGCIVAKDDGSEYQHERRAEKNACGIHPDPAAQRHPVAWTRRQIKR